MKQSIILLKKKNKKKRKENKIRDSSQPTLIELSISIFVLQATSLFAALKQQQQQPRDSIPSSRERENRERDRLSVRSRENNRNEIGGGVTEQSQQPQQPQQQQQQQELTIEYQSNGKLSPAGHTVTAAPMTQQKQPIITQQSQQPSSGAPGPQPSPHQSPQAPQRGSPPNPSQGPPPGGPPGAPPSQNPPQMMLSPASGIHQMQQLLQQHILSPTQLQSFMQQHSLYLQQQQQQHHQVIRFWNIFVCHDNRTFLSCWKM